MIKAKITKVGDGLAAKASVVNDFSADVKCVNAGLNVRCKVYVVDNSTPVVSNLNDVTSNAPAVVEKGSHLSFQLSGANEKQVDPRTVKVMMGEEDITAAAYDFTTNTVNIASVTGSVTITAAGIAMDSDYKPLPYIACIAVSGKAGFSLGFKATNKTKIHTKFRVVGGSKEYLLYEYNIPPSETHYCSLYVSSSKNYFLWNTASSGAFTPAIPTSKDVHVTIDKGVLTLGWEGQTDITKTIANETSFTASANQCIFGNRRATASGVARGRIYCYQHWEDDTLVHDYVPAVRVSDGAVGLYNTLAATNKLNVNYGNSTWVAPYVAATETLSNCTATRLSGATTGSATQAVIGSTWSIKLTPSTGYTFVGGSCSVTLDGAASSLATATYDSSTDTYTITIDGVPHDKTIAITASAVSA